MPKRLLIVDDQVDILLFLKDRLERCGYQITTAENGEEGLNIIDREPIDGILLDLEMPVMDGITMIKHLQHHLPRIPIIAMSADQAGTSLIEAISNGAQDYLFKPIAIATLLKKCQQHFE